MTTIQSSSSSQQQVAGLNAASQKEARDTQGQRTYFASMQPSASTGRPNPQPATAQILNNGNVNQTNDQQSPPTVGPADSPFASSDSPNPEPSANSGDRPRVFHSQEEADAYNQEQLKNNPDAHIDGPWDAFKRGIVRTAKNPVGTVLSGVASLAGSSEKTQQALYDIGKNPIGFTFGELAGAAGASQDTQNKAEETGAYIEYAIPAWGGTKRAGEVLAAGMEGNLSPEDALDSVQDFQPAPPINRNPAAPAKLSPTTLQPTIAPEPPSKPLLNPAITKINGQIGIPMSGKGQGGGNMRLPDSGEGRAPEQPGPSRTSSWTINKTGASYKQLTPSEQSKFDTFQNGIRSGKSPREAAAEMGGADFKNLQDDQYQIRLSRGNRVTFTIDENDKVVTILQVGGHT